MRNDRRLILVLTSRVIDVLKMRTSGVDGRRILENRLAAL